MKKVQYLLMAAFALAGATAVAQQDFSGPQFARYGETVEERAANIQASNFLAEAVKNKRYDEALPHLRQLVNDRPQASVNIFKYGKLIYRNKINRSKSRDEKYAYVDSLLMMYDMQAEYFGQGGKESAADILGNKAKEVLLYRSADREGIRNAFREAIAAADGQADPELVVIYYKNLCDDYQNDEVTADEVIAEYERLAPLFEGNAAAAESKQQFDAAFGLSGAASCENLERLFAAKLAAAPDDEAVLSQAVSLMSRAKCNSDFYFQVAEKYYEVKPSAETAMALAQVFQNEGDYDKAVKYLNEALAVETDPLEKEKLLVRIGIVELVANRIPAAAASVRQALDLNPENGLAYFVLAQCYASSAASCAGFAGQAAFWAAYDTMSKAVNYMSDEDESSYGNSARESLAAYRNRFPTSEECFFNELKEGDRYTVSCGTASGVATTVRSR